MFVSDHNELLSFCNTYLSLSARIRSSQDRLFTGHVVVVGWETAHSISIEHSFILDLLKKFTYLFLTIMNFSVFAIFVFPFQLVFDHCRWIVHRSCRCCRVGNGSFNSIERSFILDRLKKFNILFLTAINFSVFAILIFAFQPVFDHRKMDCSQVMSRLLIPSIIPTGLPLIERVSENPCSFSLFCI